MTTENETIQTHGQALQENGMYVFMGVVNDEKADVVRYLLCNASEQRGTTWLRVAYYETPVSKLVDVPLAVDELVQTRGSRRSEDLYVWRQRQVSECAHTLADAFTFRS